MVILVLSSCFLACCSFFLLSYNTKVSFSYSKLLGVKRPSVELCRCFDTKCVKQLCTWGHRSPCASLRVGVLRAGLQKPLSVDPCHYRSSSNKQLEAHYQHLPCDSISTEPSNAPETFYQSGEEALLQAAKRDVLKGCLVISFNQTETVWL